MKKIILGLLAFVLAFPAVYAQKKAGKGMNGDTKTYRHHPGKQGWEQNAMYKKLNLTREQQDKLAKINKDYRAGVADLKKKEAAITVKDYKAQMQVLGKKRRSESDNVFTPEQKAQLQQMRAERKRKFEASDKGKRGDMQSALGLSEDQSARLKALREYTQKKVKDIRGNQALSDSEKKEQVSTVFKQQREDMKSILTPEQMKKMEGFRSGRNRQISK